MSLGEFDLIARYFKDKGAQQNCGTSLGIGDDCALLDIPEGYQLAVTTDSLVADVHFFSDVDPYRLGYKALAVNLSDLAAMGATPKWISLAITLPEMNEPWLAEFSRGFFALANQFNIELIGGDTSKGPLSITVSAKGIIPRGLALQRNQAKAGDLICVSGCLGDGAVGLACKTDVQTVNNQQPFIDALELTLPRIELGILLRSLASSCLDISDGLAQDLQHTLKASNCSASIEVDKLPLSSALESEIASSSLTKERALQYALTGGDDYELLFTISARNLEQLNKRLKQAEQKLPSVTVIGTVLPFQQPLIELQTKCKNSAFSLQGWDHFKKVK